MVSRLWASLLEVAEKPQSDAGLTVKGSNPRPACHAEGRGFESHHPLLRKTPLRRGFLFPERQHGGRLPDGNASAEHDDRPPARPGRSGPELLDSILEQSSLEDANRPDDSLVVLGASFGWNDLDEAGRRLQSRLLNLLADYTPRIEFMVRVAPAGDVKSVEQATNELRELADRSHLSWHRTVDEARAAAVKAIQDHRDALASLHDPGGRPIIVPDANSTIINPALDEWEFDHAAQFEVVMTPTFLRELDDLKTTKRADDVRQTAEAVSPRIKDVRGRGNARDGVSFQLGGARSGW